MFAAAHTDDFHALMLKKVDSHKTRIRISKNKMNNLHTHFPTLGNTHGLKLSLTLKLTSGINVVHSNITLASGMASGTSTWQSGIVQDCHVEVQGDSYNIEYIHKNQRSIVRPTPGNRSALQRVFKSPVSVIALSVLIA